MDVYNEDKEDDDEKNDLSHIKMVNSSFLNVRQLMSSIFGP